MQQQLETGTQPCTTTDDLRAELRRWRERADGHAREVDCRIAALATSPVPTVPRTTLDDRYHAIAEEFGITQAEQLACGMHVHVSTESDEEGVAVIDRVRPWLSVLDDGLIYFDVRLSRLYPTVELRVAYVCPRLEVTATIAALGRALVERAAADWRRTRPGCRRARHGRGDGGG